MNCLPSVAMKGASLAAQPRAGIELGVGDAFGPRRGVLGELRLVHGHHAIDEQDVFTPAIDEHFRIGAGNMYDYPLRCGARERLGSAQGCASWEPQRLEEVRPSAVKLPSLLEELERIPDHRRGQGRKFGLSTLLALWELARLSGFKGIDATWRYACHLDPEELRAVGAWKDKAWVRHAPSRATLHRAKMETDPDALQAALNRWVGVPPKLIIFNGFLVGAKAQHCQARIRQRDRFATTRTIPSRNDCFGAARAASEWPARRAHSTACPNA